MAACGIAAVEAPRKQDEAESWGGVAVLEMGMTTACCAGVPSSEGTKVGPVNRAVVGSLSSKAKRGCRSTTCRGAVVEAPSSKDQVPGASGAVTPTHMPALAVAGSAKVMFAKPLGAVARAALPGCCLVGVARADELEAKRTGVAVSALRASVEGPAQTLRVTKYVAVFAPGAMATGAMRKAVEVPAVKLKRSRAGRARSCCPWAV
jgi:hypothetical protein